MFEHEQTSRNKNLSLSYKINNKSLQILKNVNIDLNYKESISVIGESGSGKTSLIMLIAGLEKFNSGELIFDGNNFKNLNEDELSDIRRKNIGIIFQSFFFCQILRIRKCKFNFRN